MGSFAYLPLVFVPFAVCFGADDPIAILKQLPRSPELHFSASGVYEFQMNKEAVISDSFEHEMQFRVFRSDLRQLVNGRKRSMASATF